MLDDLTLADLQRAGLYDPEAPDAPDRLELLEHLLQRGATTAEMTRAEAAGQLVAAAAHHLMFDFGNRLTVQQVAAVAGISPDRVERLRLATGLVTEPGATLPRWAAEDVAGFAMGAELFGEGPLLAFARVMGASAARLAEAAVALFLTEIENRLTAEGASPLEFARANEEAGALVDVVTVIMDHLVREHLELAIARQPRDELARDRAVIETSIGFVDLAESTRWAAGRSPREQADALAQFESAAWEIATGRGGRVVKLIGDEVMFAVADPATACRIALEICEAVDKVPELPRARGAVGIGAVAVRDGDYFGPLVHLVARAVKAAEEGGVVATSEVHERCAGVTDLAIEHLAPVELRGIDGEVQLYAVGAVGGR